MADEYASGEYRYWHLSVPSPELTQAIEDGWFPTRGRVLDLGCGNGALLKKICEPRPNLIPLGVDLD